jgi:hypothetical protein
MAPLYPKNLNLKSRFSARLKTNFIKPNEIALTARERLNQYRRRYQFL